MKRDLKLAIHETMKMQLRNTNGGTTNASPLSGPIFTKPPTPKSCGVCSKGESHLQRIYALDALYECSHVDCPHRGKVTAQRGDQ